MTKYTDEKKAGFNIRKGDDGSVEFFARANDDNSVPEDIVNKLKPYLKKYKQDKNIHHHLYDRTLMFGATKESGTFVCVYCEAAKRPLHLVVIDGIRMQEYRQIIGESLNPEKHLAKKVYIK